MKLNREQRYAAEINDAIISMFDEDSENFKHRLDEIDATAFFIGFVMAFSALYQKLSGDEEIDLLGSTHLANRLAFQYLQVHGKVRNEP